MLISLTGSFALEDFSIVSSRRNRLEQLEAKGSGGTRVTSELAGKTVRFPSPVQVGTRWCTMLVGTLSCAIVDVKLEARLRAWPPMIVYTESAAILILVTVTTYLSLILGQLVMKQVAFRNLEAVVSRSAPVPAVIARTAAPIIWLLDASTNFVLHRMGLRPGIERTATEEDIHTAVRRLRHPRLIRACAIESSAASRRTFHLGRTGFLGRRVGSQPNRTLAGASGSMKGVAHR